MAAPWKCIFCLLIGGSSAAGVCGSLDRTRGYRDPESHGFEELSEEITDFLTSGGKKTEAKDFLKEYGLTVGGFKELANVMVSGLLLEIIDGNPDEVSVLKTRLKNRLDAVRINATTGMTEAKYALYGGEEKYKKTHALKEVRRIFLEELIGHLPKLLETSTDKLENDQSSDDLIKKVLGKFYDAALDDYIQHNKPLFVSRWTFDYDDGDSEAKIKALFASSNLPESFEYPKRAGYLFPYLKDKSKFDTLKNSSNFNNPNSKLVIPLSWIGESRYSSQFIIAMLKLHKKASTEEPSKVKLMDEITKTDEASQLQEILETKYGVYFRDRSHVQFLKKEEVKKEEIKKRLIEASKSGSEYRFDIQGELKRWLEKHFERIFLSLWDKLKDNYKNLEKTKDLASKLEKLLKCSILQDSLIELRKHALRDYAALEEKHQPIAKEGGKAQRNPLLTFAGKFPYKLHQPESSGTLKKWNQTDLVLDELESIYISKLKENEGEDIAMNDDYKDEYTNSHTSFKTEWEKLFTEMKEEIKREKTDGVGLFSLPKNEENPVLENLWIRLLNGDGAKEYLMQKQMKKHFANGGTDLDNLLEESLFEKIDKNNKDVPYWKYLYRKVSMEVGNSPHPNLYKKDVVSFLFDKNKKDNLKSLLKDLKTIYSDQGKDLISQYYKSVIPELVAMEFLSKDKFNNLRKVLKARFDRNTFYAFVFGKQYPKGGLCYPDENSINEALKVDTKKVWGLENPRFLEDSQKNNGDWDPKNCLDKRDLFGLSRISKDKDEYMAGYKGLVPVEQLSKLFPEEITAKIRALPVWGKIETLIQNIGEIKTNKYFDQFLESLKSMFPEVDWSFVEGKKWHNPGETDLSLEDRKNILKGFLGSTEVPAMDGNVSLEHKYQKQKELANTKDYSNGWMSKKMTRKNGLLEDKPLIDSEGNKYVIHLTQLKYEDVADKQSWESFLNEINTDVIYQEVIRASEDKEVQKRAIHGLLNETNGLEKIKAGDDRIRRQMGLEWIG